MKSFLYAGLFFIAAMFITLTGYRNYEWFPIILSTILGYFIGRVNTLGKELAELRQALAKDWQERQAEKELKQKEEKDEKEEREIGAGAGDKAAREAPVAEQEVFEPIQSTNTAVDDSGSETVMQTAIDGQARDSKTSSTNHITNTPSHTVTISNEAEMEPYQSTQNQSVKLSTEKAKLRAAHYQEPDESLIINKAKSLVMDYFTGGNTFVRIGILLLFFGVSFLLRYVSEQGMFPIEYRLMSVAAAAIALLVFGWRLRDKKPTYSLLLQGAAVGVLYLTIFSAFSMYQLIPALPAFAILLLVSLFTAALAVLQNAQSLAFLGFAGGFLAPILASSGSNNYVGLFSYYVVLNLALLAIAWFKAWRPLNLLGFAFTFIVSTVWGGLNYKTENFSTTEPFLIIFFLMYVAIAVLFALRQPPKLRGYVDGSLLFGVPMAAAGLQYAMVKHTDYGVALSSFAFGAFYLTLAWIIWKKAGESLRLLAEAFLAVGVIFASLAIPFALDPSHTAAAWGLEGMGMIWLGSRQQRLSVRGFGLLLLSVAGFFVFLRQDYQYDRLFMNSTFISSIMMAIASILSARILHKPFAGKQDWEELISPLLLAMGLGWLFGGFIYQVSQHLGHQWLTSSVLILTAVVSVVFTLVAKRSRPEWQHAWYVSLLLMAVMLPAAFNFLNAGFVSKVFNDLPLINPLVHPSIFAGWLAWPIAFGALYWILFQFDKLKVMQTFVTPLHTIAPLLLIALLTWEGAALIVQWLPEYSAWNGVWLVVPALLGLWLFVKKTIWPFTTHYFSYLYYASAVLLAYLAIWSVFAVTNRGSSDLVMWLPILNPLDITLAIVLFAFYYWWKAVGSSVDLIKTNSRWILGTVAVLGFAWLNFTLFRIAHHYFAVVYHPASLFNSPLVQTSMSIMWTLLGVFLTIFASHKQRRTLWMIGGGVLVLVVIKLFIIDLSEVGKLARIISFLVVGVLLTSIGYFAPIPVEEDEYAGDIDDNGSDKTEGNKVA